MSDNRDDDAFRSWLQSMLEAPEILAKQAEEIEQVGQELKRMMEPVERLRAWSEWWCPVEWRDVLRAYQERGVTLDFFRLAGVVQYLGTSTPGRYHKLNPDAPVSSLPPRTTDLVRRVSADPHDDAAIRRLADRGYRVDDKGRIATLPQGRGRPPLLWRTAAQELGVYLWGQYNRVPAWKGDERVPQRLVGHVHMLLFPYWPDLTEARVRNALEDLER